MIIWNEEKKYILKYDWPKYSKGFVLETKNLKEDEEITFLKTSTNIELFEDIVNACYPFPEFCVTVRRQILPHPKYSDRTILGEHEPIEIKDWDIESKINDKYYGVTNIVFKKIENK